MTKRRDQLLRRIMAGLDSGFPAATLYECASIRGLDLDQVLSPESMSEICLLYTSGEPPGVGVDLTPHRPAQDGRPVSEAIGVAIEL